MRKNFSKDSVKLKGSISYKIVAMFVVLTISVIIVIGTFMINRIDAFYHDEFKTLMRNVYSLPRGRRVMTAPVRLKRALTLIRVRWE